MESWKVHVNLSRISSFTKGTLCAYFRVLIDLSEKSKDVLHTHTHTYMYIIQDTAACCCHPWGKAFKLTKVCLIGIDLVRVWLCSLWPSMFPISPQLSKLTDKPEMELSKLLVNFLLKVTPALFLILPSIPPFSSSLLKYSLIHSINNHWICIMCQLLF